VRKKKKTKSEYAGKVAKNGKGPGKKKAVGFERKETYSGDSKTKVR